MTVLHTKTRTWEALLGGDSADFRVVSRLEVIVPALRTLIVPYGNFEAFQCAAEQVPVLENSQLIGIRFFEAAII